MRFNCIRCKHKFEKNRMPTLCPFCGKENALQQEPGAQQFVDEANPDDASDDDF